jgi:23S rRNA (adenine2503-C2)-methyltransferase
VFIKGFNSGPDEVRALKKLFGGTRFKLNLIDVNDARPGGYERADDAERAAFYHHLQELHVPVVRRYSVGNSKHSACGMLAGKKISEMALSPPLLKYFNVYVEGVGGVRINDMTDSGR